jgi:ankyrin repeat protein
MHCAAQYGHAGTVALLHTHGANVNAVDEDGLSPLHMAAQYGHAATISLLIGIGGNLNLQNKAGRTVLIAAVQYGHAGTAKLLLDRKADINLGDSKVRVDVSKSLFICFFCFVSLCRVASLLRRLQGRTPLRAAAQYGHAGTVNLLINYVCT